MVLSFISGSPLLAQHKKKKIKLYPECPARAIVVEQVLNADTTLFYFSRNDWTEELKTLTQEESSDEQRMGYMNFLDSLMKEDRSINMDVVLAYSNQRNVGGEGVILYYWGTEQIFNHLLEQGKVYTKDGGDTVLATVIRKTKPYKVAKKCLGYTVYFSAGKAERVIYQYTVKTRGNF